MFFILTLKSEEKIDPYAEQNFTVSKTCDEEIKSLLGLLILSVAMKNKHLATDELFYTTLCRQRYKVGMSDVIFLFLLLNYLRFDAKQASVF